MIREYSLHEEYGFVIRNSYVLQPRQPLPGILDFGQAGVGVFLLKFNTT